MNHALVLAAIWGGAIVLLMVILWLMDLTAHKLYGAEKAGSVKGNPWVGALGAALAVGYMGSVGMGWISQRVNLTAGVVLIAAWLVMLLVNYRHRRH